jgi:hypothetical protein
MTAAHTTLLEYLGKYITYDLAVDHSFDPSGYVQESGQVTGVFIELNGNHQFRVKFDNSDNYEFVSLSDIKLK